MTVLYAVIDTNLFHECLKLDAPNFPWQALGDYEEIHLIVTSPVQRELDGHKKDSRPRIKRRAIEAVKWFREMLNQPTNTKIIRDNNPRVVLSLDATTASSGHSQILDYTIRDDSIVGCAISVQNSKGPKNVVLLTHDTGPAMKAKAVGIPFMFVPEIWLRPEEEDDQQKEITRLKQQVNFLQSSSPALSVQPDCALDNGCVTLRRNKFKTLAVDEVAELITLLSSKISPDFIKASNNINRAARDGALRFNYRHIAPTEFEIDKFVVMRIRIGCPNALSVSAPWHMT